MRLGWRDARQEVEVATVNPRKRSWWLMLWEWSGNGQMCLDPKDI